MEELWKDIPNYNGYQVSNLGNVRTYNKITYTKKHGLRHWKNRILKYKGETYETGYRVDLWKNGKPHSYLVARLVAFTFYNEDINNKKLTVDHLDGNRFNNKLENLELVSLQENIKRAFDNELMACKKTKIINKNTGYNKTFRSMSLASKAIGHRESYISAMLKKGKNENENFKWQIL